MDNTEQNNVPNPQQEVPQMTNTTPTTTSLEKKSSWGPVIGLVIILALIIIGGLYFLMQDQNVPENPEANNSEQDLNDLRSQSSSDSLAEIEADLESTNLDNLDAELDLIESEF